MPLSTCGVVPATLAGVGVADYRPVISVPNQSTPQKRKKDKNIIPNKPNMQDMRLGSEEKHLYIKLTLITLP
jgi:hypothetical protein